MWQPRIERWTTWRTGDCWESPATVILWPGKPCAINQSIATSNQREQYPQDRARARENDWSTGSLTETATPRVRTDTSNNGNRVCSCGKVLKNKQGLNIHRARMRCPQIVNLEQRAREFVETSEGPHPSQYQEIMRRHANSIELI